MTDDMWEFHLRTMLDATRRVVGPNSQTMRYMDEQMLQLAGNQRVSTPPPQRVQPLDPNTPLGRAHIAFRDASLVPGSPLAIIDGNLSIVRMDLPGIVEDPPEERDEVGAEELCFAYETEQEETTEERLCPVCLDPIDPAAKHVKFSCGHRSHTDCIREWLATKRTCSICRESVEIY